MHVKVKWPGLLAVLNQRGLYDYPVILGGAALTRERHRLALIDTAAALTRCLEANLPELAAEDLRLALRSLGSITEILVAWRSRLV